MGKIVDFRRPLSFRVVSQEEHQWRAQAYARGLCRHPGGRVRTTFPGTPDEERRCGSCGAWWYVYDPEPRS